MVCTLLLRAAQLALDQLTPGNGINVTEVSSPASPALLAPDVSNVQFVFFRNVMYF